MTISEILLAAGYLCAHPPYKGNSRKYVTYQLITQVGILYAEGREQETGVLYGVDFYTDTAPFTTDLAAIKAALQANGYTCEIGAEQYESDTRLWHIAMTSVTQGAIY